MTTPSMIINCPTCQKTISWTDAYPHKPFCSDRCKLIDLGAWADETHRIPVENLPTEGDELPLDDIE